MTAPETPTKGHNRTAHGQRYADFGIMCSPLPQAAHLWGFFWAGSAHNYSPFKNCMIASARGRDG
jgi:hypothetical protein